MANLTREKAAEYCNSNSNNTKILNYLNSYLTKHHMTLSQYYLSYYAQKYNVDLSGKTDASLKDLPEEAILDMSGAYGNNLVGGNALGAFVMDSEVNAALYDYFWNRLVTVNSVDTNGKEIVGEHNSYGDYMRGTSDGKLEEAFRSAIGVLTGNGTSSGVISMLSDYNGPLAKNAYSDYSFAVRLNFQLSQKAYNATYVWEGDHPDAAVPTDSTKYHKGDTVTADTTQYVAGKTSLAGTKDGVEGTWTFNKWTPGEYANITGNVQFVGTWTFTPTPAPVTPDPTQPTDPTKPVVPVTPVTPDPENPQNPTTPAKTTTTTPASDKSPTTGDNWNGGLMMMLILLGAAGAFTPLALRKKESEK